MLILREILRYVENLYDVSKNFDVSEKFLDPKMVHWPKFFWRRGGGGEGLQN
jgi:hypothetical protein